MCYLVEMPSPFNTMRNLYIEIGNFDISSKDWYNNAIMIMILVEMSNFPIYLYISFRNFKSPWWTNPFPTGLIPTWSNLLACDIGVWCFNSVFFVLCVDLEYYESQYNSFSTTMSYARWMKYLDLLYLQLLQWNSSQHISLYFV